MSTAGTVAHAVAETLAAYGVERMFGVPGGGSSLEVIAAAADVGIDFVLCHGETAAAIMASVTADLTGAPGVVLTGLGPGAASVVNGYAFAHLDRSPLLVISDSYDPATHAFVTHQMIDHAGFLAPIGKGSRRLDGETPAASLAALLDRALAHPRGPVHLDLSAREAALPTGERSGRKASPAAPAPSADLLERIREALRGSRKPVIVAGLEARDPAVAAALAALAARLDCPVLATYKAKGVVADDDPRSGGMFTGGAAEAPWLAEADLFILAGLDPVELIAQPWPYRAPVVEIAESAVRPHYLEPAISLTGAVAPALEALAASAEARAWRAPERPGDRRLASGNAVPGPEDVVDIVRAAAPADARLTVDAGAHMLPAMQRWRASAAHDVLISNGLSTMGFALPAAIAAALADPGRRTVAFIGDGGLMMCAPELATAARNRLPLTVVVFNDAALSMIDLKQQQKGHPSRGVRYPAIDFATMAEGMGCRSFRADSGAALERVLPEALAADGPALVDVRVDPSGYRAQFEALRGAGPAPKR